MHVSRYVYVYMYIVHLHNLQTQGRDEWNPFASLSESYIYISVWPKIGKTK